MSLKNLEDGRETNPQHEILWPRGLGWNLTYFVFFFVNVFHFVYISLNFSTFKMKLADGLMDETGIKLWNRQIRRGKKLCRLFELNIKTKSSELSGRRPAFLFVEKNKLQMSTRKVHTEKRCTSSVNTCSFFSSEGACVRNCEKRWRLLTWREDQRVIINVGVNVIYQGPLLTPAV